MKKRPSAVKSAIAMAVMGLVCVPFAAHANGKTENSSVLPVASEAEDVGMSTERLMRIDRTLQAYVDDNEVAGVVAMIGRHGKIAYQGAFGMADLESGREMQTDTIFLISQMTEPVVSVAAMMLYEEGHFRLIDPISKFIPEFEEMEVLIPEGDTYSLVPAERPVTMRDLLNDSSGIGFQFNAPPALAELYSDAGLTDGMVPFEGTLGESVRKIAKMPLMDHPGRSWEIGMSIDVVGHLIEVISGMSLAQFLEERIFTPLAMNDTHGFLPEDKIKRLATVYGPAPEGGLQKYPEGENVVGPYVFSLEMPYSEPHSYFSASAQLTSTAADYGRFLQMLANGGELGGIRLLSRKTVELMTSNQIGENYVYFRQSGDKAGLGFAVRTERGQFDEVESLGSYAWAGIFYTSFWVDPEEDMWAVLMAGLVPHLHSSLRGVYRILAYQAIDD